MKSFIPLYTALLIMILPLAASGQRITVAESKTEADLNAVYFSDLLHGWAAGEAGTILKTKDGGETWSPILTRYSGTLHAITFFDHLTGWIAGDDYLVIYTDDAGRQWSDRRPGSTGGRSISNLFAFDPKRIWSAGGPGPWIYSSENGGQTWLRHRVVPDQCTVTSIQFTSPITGFFSSCSEIRYTENGGQTWNVLQIEGLDTAGGFNSFEISDLQMVSSQSGFASVNTTEGGSIFRITLTPGGWMAVKLFDTGLLSSLGFIDGQTGWASGNNGLMLYTSDSGTNWQVIGTGLSSDLNDIHVTAAGTVWITGNNGTLIKAEHDRKKFHPMHESFTLYKIDSEREAIELLNRALRYGELAIQIDHPLYRMPLYRKMRTAMESVAAYYSGSRMPDAISDRIRDVPAHYRAEEQNRGVERFNAFQNKKFQADTDSLLFAIYNFSNAVTLLPDSTSSWLNLALAELEWGDPEAALVYAENAYERKTDMTPGHYDLLIRLYLIQERIAEANEMAQRAKSDFPDEPVFLEYLADIGLRTPKSDRVTPEALDLLIESYPHNPEYRYVRAIRIFNVAVDELDRTVQHQREIWNTEEERFGKRDEERRQIDRKIMRLQQEKERLLQSGNRKADLARADLLAAIASEPEHAESFALLAEISLKRAAVLEELRLFTSAEKEAGLMDENIFSYLSDAAGWLEKAVQAEPENREYRTELRRVKEYLEQIR